MSTLFSLKVFCGGGQCQCVAVGAETDDRADGDIGKMGMVTECFPRGDVRQMHFDERHGRGQQRVAQGHAGVRVGRGIEDDAVDVLDAGCMNAIHQRTFAIGLETVEPVAVGSRLVAQVAFDGRQRANAVQAWLARAKQVQIGAVKQQEASHAV